MTFPLLVVIHETLISAEDSILLHADPSYYGSYHALIHRSGKITYLVPGDCKAYAAANSSFLNREGIEEHVNNSVDDFSYHIALETPPDGVKNIKSLHHIGYTKEQYSSLAWLIKATGVLLSRVISHSDVSKSEIIEPRCFNNKYLQIELEKASNSKSINLGILDYNLN